MSNLEELKQAFKFQYESVENIVSTKTLENIKTCVSYTCLPINVGERIFYAFLIKDINVNPYSLELVKIKEEEFSLFKLYENLDSKIPTIYLINKDYAK